jgi:hypothetical protein
MTPAKAQIVVIPHGGGGDDGLETFLIVAISLVLLGVAVVRTYRAGELDRVVDWIAKQFRRLFGR